MPRDQVHHHNPEGATEGLHGWILAAVVAGLLLALSLSALDATVVGTALPQITRDLHGLALYSWVVTAYLLASTTMIPIVGKLSDQFGRKGFILGGVALFLTGSALGGTSQTMTQLILARALQGMGAGFLQTTAFTIVADLFPPAERGKWQGLFVGVVSMALIVGPLIGGVLTDRASWNWVFYVNLPVGLASLALLAVWLPSDLATGKRFETKETAVRRIDFAGALCAAAATICVLLGLTWGGAGREWGSLRVESILLAAGTLYLAFVFVERHAHEPLLPLDLFANQVFTASGLLSLAGGMVFYGVIFYLPLFVQGVLGQTATNSGASLTPLFIPVAISAVLGGQLIDRLGRYQVTAMAGAGVLVVGMAAIVRLDVHATLEAVTLCMIVVGLGFGLLQPSYIVAAQNAIPIDRLGAGTAAVTYMRAMGSLLGTAVLGAFVASSASSVGSSVLTASARQQLATAIDHAFMVTLAAAVGMLVLTFFLKDVRLRKRGERTA